MSEEEISWNIMRPMNNKNIAETAEITYHYSLIFIQIY